MLSYLLTLIEDESDKAFFEELYRKYQQQMWFKAHGILNDEHLAEDAVQNAFFKIAKHIKTVRGLKSIQVRPYLVITAKHAAIDIIKKTSNEIVLSNVFEECDEYTTNDIIEAEENSYIMLIISKLPQIYRDALYMHFVLDLPEKAVAEALNLKVNTVRQHVARGRRLFAELYKKESDYDKTKQL